LQSSSRYKVTGTSRKVVALNLAHSPLQLSLPKFGGNISKENVCPYV